MTFQPMDPMEPPRQPDFRPNSRSRGRRGCLIGCGVAIAVMVVLAVALGLFAKHTYDGIVGNNEKTTTTVSRADARQLNAVQYGELVGHHGSTLSTEANTVSAQCKSALRNTQPCRAAVEAMHTELLATKADLNNVKAPAGLANTDAKLRQSVVDGLSGTGDVDSGLNGHPLTLAKGLIEVAKAAAELRQAETQLNGSLGTTVER